MLKRLNILLFVALLSNAVFAQFIGRDNLSVSLFYMQKSELDSAKKYIDLATEEESLNTTAKLWYYRGFIYKDVYKTNEKDDKQSSSRLVSIEAFKTMLQKEGKEEFAESTDKILKYLASTLYNDAVRSLNPESYELAISNFDLYKNTMIIVDPNMDIK